MATAQDLLVKNNPIIAMPGQVDTANTVHGVSWWQGKTERELCLMIKDIKSQADQDPSSFHMSTFTRLVSIIKAISALRLSTTDDHFGEGEAASSAQVQEETEAFVQDAMPTFLQLRLKPIGLDHLATPLMDLITELKEFAASLGSLDASGMVGGNEVSTIQAELSVLSKKIAVFQNLIPDLIFIPWSWDVCAKLVGKISREYNNISPALLPIHTRLLELKRELSDLKTSMPSLVRIQAIQRELIEIDSARLDGKWIDLAGAVVPGQATILFLLEECFGDCNQLLGMREPIMGGNPLRPHYEELISIKKTLEGMLQEVAEDDLSGLSMQDDLIEIQEKLGKIDDMRSDGKFLDPKSPDTVPEGQAVMHFLLHKNYRMVHRLQIIIPWMDERLHPYLMKLGTLRRCLTELVRWKVWLTREESLPYQMKYASILRDLPPLPANGRDEIVEGADAAAVHARETASVRMAATSTSTLASVINGGESDRAEEMGDANSLPDVPEGLERLHLLARDVGVLLRGLIVSD